MKGDKTRKTKQNNKTAILEKLKKSIMIEEVDSKGVEDLIKNVDNPDDAAELIERVERIMNCKKNNILMLAYQQGLYLFIFLENIKAIASSGVPLLSSKLARQRLTLKQVSLSLLMITLRCDNRLFLCTF